MTFCLLFVGLIFSYYFDLKFLSSENTNFHFLIESTYYLKFYGFCSHHFPPSWWNRILYPCSIKLAWNWLYSLRVVKFVSLIHTVNGQLDPRSIPYYGNLAGGVIGLSSCDADVPSSSWNAWWNALQSDVYFVTTRPTLCIGNGIIGWQVRRIVFRRLTLEKLQAKSKKLPKFSREDRICDSNFLLQNQIWYPILFFKN